MTDPAQPVTTGDLKRIVSLANDIFFRDLKAADKWLRTPREAFGGKAPVEIIKTKEGAEKMESYLMNVALGGSGISQDQDASKIADLKGLVKKAFNFFRDDMAAELKARRSGAWDQLQKLGWIKNLQGKPDSEGYFGNVLPTQQDEQEILKRMAMKRTDEWLRAPSKTFDGVTPLEIAKTKTGLRILKGMIGPY